MLHGLLGDHLESGGKGHGNSKCHITKPISVASRAHAREDVTQPPGEHLNKQTKTQSWVRAILMEAHDGNKMALQIAAGGLVTYGY